MRDFLKLPITKIKLWSSNSSQQSINKVKLIKNTVKKIIKIVILSLPKRFYSQYDLNRNGIIFIIHFKAHHFYKTCTHLQHHLILTTDLIEVVESKNLKIYFFKLHSSKNPTKCKIFLVSVLSKILEFKCT